MVLLNYHYLGTQDRPGPKPGWKVRTARRRTSGRTSKLWCANVKKLVRRANKLRGFLPVVIGILPKVEMSQNLKFAQLNENSLNMIRL